MKSNAISLSQKQIIRDLETPTLGRATPRSRRIRAVTLRQSVKGRCKQGGVNLPLSANPLEEGETCLCCSENALQWCRLVFFQQERGRRSPTHRPSATSSSACTGEGGEDENTGAR